MMNYYGINRGGEGNQYRVEGRGGRGKDKEEIRELKGSRIGTMRGIVTTSWYDGRN